ncbi:hypothetical protein GBAR_LOCUS9714 [Geodia barretti]|uniref:Putative regulatory protein FmdB zinc ribbon domain-containing protein n=1 Tax=Geodia barretti TaxID=519541 RepID=A0AA35RR54_GEOBA|nr:hypothetical protein GBAR_LOCUS9714 [Geodia barretti]
MGVSILPAYDYKCNSCSHRFEERQSFYADPVATCPECESEASRQFVAVPIVFKGSGFYVNDYGKSSSYKSTKSDTNGASADSGKSEESSSKPAEKAKSSTSGSDE